MKSSESSNRPFESFLGENRGETEQEAHLHYRKKENNNTHTVCTHTHARTCTRTHTCGHTHTQSLSKDTFDVLLVRERGNQKQHVAPG